jgi:hypothetical protein
VVREGKTLRQRVVDVVRAGKAKAAAGDKPTRISRSYVKELMSLYGDTTGMVASLAVKDASQGIAEGLIQGLECATRNNPAQRSCDALVAWLQHTPTLNQKECVGLLKTIAMHPNMSRPASDLLTLELMKCVVRLGYQASFKDELSVFVHYMDGALSRAFTKCKRAGFSLQISADLRGLLRPLHASGRLAGGDGAQGRDHRHRWLCVAPCEWQPDWRSALRVGLPEAGDPALLRRLGRLAEEGGRASLR